MTKYQDTTITINREEDFKISSDLFVTVGFSIDADMTAEEPQTWENPGCPAEVDQWLNIVLDDNNIQFYTNVGKPLEWYDKTVSHFVWEKMEDTLKEIILDRAEDTSNDWIAEEI
jgi:hypothetical protein